jgi:hypothetical protein
MRTLALHDPAQPLGGWDLTPEQEGHALEVLFELFDAFLAGREAATSGA